jgi:voltage-gated sodium channel
MLPDQAPSAPFWQWQPATSAALRALSTDWRSRYMAVWFSRHQRSRPPLRTWLKTIVEADLTRNLIIGLIVINAIVIGLETSPSAMESAGSLLKAIDLFCLSVFIVEIAAKLIIYRWAFFRDPWNVFDFLIVGAALLPSSAGFSVLRALRILRALRLVSAVPKMRQVVQALLGAVPAMGSVIGLLGLMFYIAAVMATKLFGEGFDEWFGSIGRSLYSLFQIMTLESWSMGIVRPVMEVYPEAWIFFVPFILITSFAVLNLFIAIIVNAMHDAADEEEDEKDKALKRLLNEVGTLRDEIGALRKELGAQEVGEPTASPAVKLPGQ